jgi:hypothetical protein
MTVLHAGLGFVLAMVVASVQGSAIVQRFEVGNHFPNQIATGTFQYFDNSSGLQTLQSVTIETNLQQWSGFFAVDNDDTTLKTGLANKGVTANISSSAPRLNPIVSSGLTLLDMTNLNLIMTKTFNLQPNSGDMVGQYNQTLASDWDSLVGPTYANRNEMTRGPVQARYQSDYMWDLDPLNATFDITFITSQQENFSGSGNLWTSGGASEAAGYIQIVYTYIPEPGSLSLLGLGAAGLLLRRRKSK